jgi:hypothetical protein
MRYTEFHKIQIVNHFLRKLDMKKLHLLSAVALSVISGCALAGDGNEQNEQNGQGVNQQGVNQQGVNQNVIGGQPAPNPNTVVDPRVLNLLAHPNFLTVCGDPQNQVTMELFLSLGENRNGSRFLRTIMANPNILDNL